MKKFGPVPETKKGTVIDRFVMKFPIKRSKESKVIVIPTLSLSTYMPSNVLRLNLKSDFCVRFYHGGIHRTDKKIYGSIFVFGDKINGRGN